MGEKMRGKIENNERKFRAPWRSFYWHILLVLAFFIIILTQHIMMRAPDGYQRYIWGVFLVFLAIVAISVLQKRFCTVFIIKNDEIAFESGLIGRRSTEISATDINTVYVKQSIMQRILNIGDIKVASAGTSGYEIEVQDMPSPYILRDEIQEAERNAKRSQGIDSKRG